MTVVTDSLQEQVKNVIKTRILDKEYTSGTQIPTKEICEEFGISSMPVRTSLHELVSLGLVVNRERVGFFVKKFSVDEAYKIMEVRKLFEIYSLSRYFDNINRDVIRPIGVQSAQQDISIRFQELDFRLHQAIIVASNNEFIIDSYMRIQDIIEMLANKDTSNEHLANKEHISVISAILSNDHDKAKQSLELHLLRVEKEIEDAIVSEG